MLQWRFWATQLSKQIAKRSCNLIPYPVLLLFFIANNREAGDFRRHRAHYDVTNVNKTSCFLLSTNIDEQNFCILYLSDSNSVVNSKSWLYKVSKIYIRMRKYICFQWSMALVLQLEFPSKVNRSNLENSWIIKHAYLLISMNKK